MIFELKLGTLIRKLNPYTNGAMRTMHCGAQPPLLSANLAADLVATATAIQTYVNNPNAANLKAVEDDEDKADADMGVIDIDLVVDNDYSQDYMTWIFRGQSHAVKRALRMQYRYELMDKAGKPTGIYAIEHVLIGYAGSNG